MDKIINGQDLRDQILLELKQKITKNQLVPKLAIVQVGEDPASTRYINQKIKFGEEIGAEVKLFQVETNISFPELKELINKLNTDNSVTGIIVQLPLPKHLDPENVTNLVDPAKDVDGLTDNSLFEPATPSGVMKILEEYKVPIKGKTAVVLGRSKLVGSPIKQMLEEIGAEVIQIHSQTPKPIDPLVLKGDIVISAVGQPRLVTANMVKKGAVVIDVGINRDSETGKLIGDVDFDNVKNKVSLITPVPGGVGPMTVAMLMKNLVIAATN